MAAATGGSPAVARHRVRRALRQARDTTELSQGDVAKRLGWSLSKMQRIEGGEVGVSPTDLRALLEIYGIADRAQVDRLVEDARASRRQRYETPPEHREHVSAGLLELMQFERQATSIQVYQPLFFPGFVQTPAVAEAILDRWKTGLTPDERRIRFDVRMSRRKRLVESPDGPDCLLVLDESVIKRRVGNIKVTAEQLEDMAELAQLPHVRIRIVPFVRGGYMPAISGFQLVNLDGDASDSVLYTEELFRDEVVHDPQKVEFFRSVFDELWSLGLSEDASVRAILAEAAYFRTLQDREEV